MTYKLSVESLARIVHHANDVLAHDVLGYPSYQWTELNPLLRLAKMAEIKAHLLADDLDIDSVYIRARQTYVDHGYKSYFTYDSYSDMPEDEQTILQLQIFLIEKYKDRIIIEVGESSP